MKRVSAALAVVAALAAGCGLSNIPVASTKPRGPGIGGGGGGGGGGSDGGLDGGQPDGSVPPPSCFLCGASSDVDAGCPVGLVANYQSTATAFVCVCTDLDGGTGCQFCDPSNPQNGGCGLGLSCDGHCPPGGYFYLCDPVNQPPVDACFPDAGL